MEVGRAGVFALKGDEQAHHTAQLPTLAAFPPWGGSEGAGRVSRRKFNYAFWLCNFIYDLFKDVGFKM